MNKGGQLGAPPFLLGYQSMLPVDETKVNKITVLSLKHVKFDRILKQLRKAYIEETTPPQYLAVPYIITCSAALESRLNDEIVRFSYESFDKAGREMAESFLSMTFRGKLNAIVPLLTSNIFVFNTGHEVYKKLLSLIKVRNFLVHPKSFFEDISIQQEVDPNTGKAFPYPVSKKLAELGEDLSLGSTKEYTPTEYHDALDKFEKIFFKNIGKPNRLAKTGLIIPNTKKTGAKQA
jgi:hypothetical protein